MTKSKTLSRSVYTRMPVQYEAVLRFYAHKYSKEMSDIQRRIIFEYAAHDKRFEVSEFAAFVHDVLLPQFADDELMQNEIKNRTEELIGEIKAKRGS